MRAVREDAIDRLLKPVIQEEEELLRKINSKLHPLSIDEKKRALKRLRKLESQVEDVRQLPAEELFKASDQEYDWMKIAAQNFEGTMTPETCR